ncbi:hypothetical protein BD779DRAFT_1513732 [Infundibulicybe gibba]|nr:hypothetical protein BD779DRAFT_1513732 [Infundibulicybe gibba]
MDSFDKIEEYMESLEEYFFSSLSAATTDLPNIHDAVNRLWVDIARYGPGMPAFPEVRIAGLGDFEVPPPPTPLPSPASSGWIGRSAGWVGQNPWKTTGVIIGVVGTGLLVGYRLRSRRRRHVYQSAGASPERRQVVVVLGGDMPIALPLILNLEKKGYIVIASVATPDAVENLEHECQGYVRALVLDPHEPATIPVFLRSLASTLSRRFPMTAAGDPYVSPASLPYIHSIISLLTLPEPLSCIRAPIESISLRSTYLSHLNATHITPLQVIQALLPLLRTGPARSRDKGKKSIIICLPAIDARVGLPFSATQSMSAASTLRGVEVLRREINAAALTGKSEAMKNIKVVVVDVGALAVETQSEVHREESVYKSMEGWTASEKPANYWCSFFTLFKDSHQYQFQRKPSDINIFVNNIVTTVSGGRFGPTVLGLHLGRIANWVRGERFSVGAGASTYRLASHFPAFLLDGLLNLPHVLISIRNALLPASPFVLPPSPRTAPRSHPVPHTTPTPQLDEARPNTASDNDQSDTTSDVDVESNSGGSGADSWVRLKTED